MVREDNTEGAPKKQKSAGLGPATLDLSATEVTTESGAADAQAQQTSAPEQGGQDTAAKPETAANPASPESPESAPDVPPPPRPDVFDAAPQRSRIGLPLALAALLGGVVGGVLVIAAGALGLVGSRGRSGDDNLTPRIVAIEQDVASFKASVDQAASKAAAVEATAKSAQESANNALSLAGDAQKAADKAAERPAPTANVSVEPAAPAPDLAPLSDRLTKAESDIAALRGALDQAGAASAAVTQLQSQLDAGRKQGDEALQDDRKQIAALQAAISARPEKAAAYAVALSLLGEALRSGRPFAGDLRTAVSIGSSLGADVDGLKPLAGLAESGAPTIAALGASFDTLKPAIIAAVTPKAAALPANAGVVDRLMSSLGSVVTVTREGEPQPDDPALPVQKVADALRHGDLAAAIAAFNALPPEGQQAGAAWLVQARSVAVALDTIKAETSATLQKFSGQ